MPSPWRVKIIDFDKVGKIAPEFADADGIFNPETLTIYLNSKLPLSCNGTRRSVKEHEIVHARLHIAGVQVGANAEENLATLVSVCSTPRDYQSTEEAAFKRILIGSKSWARKADRPWIVRRCCRVAGLPAPAALVKALSCPVKELLLE